MIDIDQAGDFVVRATEKAHSENGRTIPSRAQEFRVRKDVLIKASEPWKDMLVTQGQAPASKVVRDFCNGPILSTEILLRGLHEAVDVDSYDASIKAVWQLAPLLLKWKLQVECLISWFAEWYFVKGFQERQLFHQGQTEEQLQEQLRKCELEQRQLLFPCWRFRHHSGFALATRFLVYNSYRHIVEFSPLESREFHLPPLIIGALNAARGRLRTILHRSIHRPKIELVRASCECSAHINKGYEMALYQAKIWPFEEIEKTDSMGTILRRIPTFRYEAPESACEDSCHKNKNYNKLVDEAGTEVETYFGGLCLDCLDRTRPKTGDEHSDYWNHNRFHNERAWFKGCSFRHREPTWYNSFMGGEAAKDTLKAMAKAREEEPHYKDNKFNYARFERMARKRALELQKGQS